MYALTAVGEGNETVALGSQYALRTCPWRVSRELISCPDTRQCSHSGPRSGHRWPSNHTSS